MRVLRQGSRTAIEVSRGYKNAQLIAMDAQGLRVVAQGLDVVDREWREVEYPVHRAADKYLLSTRHLGGTTRAITILKEILMHYIIDKSGSVVSAGNKKDMQTEFGKLPEEARLKTHKIVSDPEGLRDLSLVALSALYNSMVEPEDAVKKFGDKEKAAERAWDALESQHDPKVRARAQKAAQKTEKVAKTKKSAPEGAKVPRESSKMGQLYLALQDGSKTLKELSAASGYDEQNTRTAVGILRSKNGIGIEYDRNSKTYALA